MTTDDEDPGTPDAEDLVRKYARYLPKRKTAIQELREYSRAYVSQKYAKAKTLSTPKIAKEIEAHFPPEFYERLGRERAHDIVYDFLQHDLAPNQQTKILRTLTDYSPERQVKVMSVFTSWREEVEPGNKMLLIMMGIEETTKAGNIRIARGRQDMLHGKWLHHLRSRLKGAQKVGQVWTFEELDATFKKMVPPKK